MLPVALAAKYGLPIIGAIGGALPGIRRGNLGEAALGAGTGALTGYGLTGPVRAGTLGAMRMAGPGLGRSALGATALGAGGLGTFGLSGGVGGVAGPVTGQVGQAAAGQLGYKTPSGEFVPLGDPAAVGQFGGVPPIGGSPLDVINPAGRDAARRLTQRKDAETLRDNINLVLPTVEKFADRSKQRDLQRNLAAAGVRANIEGNVEQLLAAQQAVNQMGLNAQQGAINALQTQYNYR